MASERRIQGLNTLLRKEIADIILDQERLSKEIFTTVTKVETSSNLSIAKVYISVWPDSQYPKVASLLQHDIKNIQKQIDKMLPIRVVPKIIFVEDKSQRKASRVEQILDKLDHQGHVAK